MGKTEREQKEVRANIDNLHKAGLGQGFGIVEFGMKKGILIVLLTKAPF
jgi:hypothetical protein